MVKFTVSVRINKARFVQFFGKEPFFILDRSVKVQSHVLLIIRVALDRLMKAPILLGQYLGSGNYC